VRAERRCEGCGEPFEVTRPNRRYHDARCRKAAFLRRQHEREMPVSTMGLDREAVIEEALSEPRLVVYIAKAAQTNWRAAAWLLERRYPQRWAYGSQPEVAPDPADPFVEVDELAARRRQQHHD
jgi:hypothetical protein